MLTGGAPRTILNCVFMAEKTKLSAAARKHTPHILNASRSHCPRGRGPRGGGEAGLRRCRAGELPFAKSIRVSFVLNADYSLCHGGLDFP